MTSQPILLKLLLASFALGGGVTHAATFLMDFGTNGSGGYPGGASAWNAYTNATAIIGKIKDTAGSDAANVTIGSSGTISTSGNERF